MDFRKVVAKVALTQPLTDRRDYGSSNGEDEWGVIADVAEILEKITDALEHDDAKSALELSKLLLSSVDSLASTIEAKSEFQPEEYDIDIGELEKEEEAMAPTVKFEGEEEAPPTLRSQYSFWSKLPGPESLNLI